MEKDSVKLEGIIATVKEVKANKNGITLNFEDVDLTSEQVSQVASLVDTSVFISITKPEMNDIVKIEGQMTIDEFLEEPSPEEEKVVAELDLEN